MVAPIIPWSAREIATITGGVLHGKENWSARDISTDTRTLKPGQVFIALDGAHFHGGDFLAAARKKGAVAAVIGKRRDIALAQIVVDDPLTALQTLARERRRRSGAFCVALTGSNGKTSTKEMLRCIFARVGATLATSGNLNNMIGVPLTLLDLRDRHRFAVIEMGASHEGEIARLVRLAEPDVALITNVSAAHLEGFGSMAGVIRAKSEIYRDSARAIVINNDLDCAEQWRNRFAGRLQKTFSLSGNGDVTAREIAADGRGFTLFIAGERRRIEWRLRGRHNVTNALAACAAAHLAGVSVAQMAAALAGLTLGRSRLGAIQFGPHLIYDDTYNANPASFRVAIDVIAMAQHPLVIAGSMSELGGESAALHRGVGEYARRRGIAAFWTLNAPQYGAGFPEARHFDALEALVAAFARLLKGKTPRTVLIKGSRSARMERVLTAVGASDANKGLTDDICTG